MKTLYELEAELLKTAYFKNNKNLIDTAKVLNIGKMLLYRKLKEHNII